MVSVSSAGATIVTGASAGIGLALSHRFAATSPRLLMVARQAERLEAAAGHVRATGKAEVRTLSLDAAAEDAPSRIESALAAAGWTLEILVNNAAAGHAGPFLSSSRAGLEAIVDLNMRAPTVLCHAFLPGMIGRGRGGILNVASLAGMVPFPGMTAYAASKAYVLSLTRALAEETRGTGVHVAALVPGFVRTEFLDIIGLDLARWIPQLNAETVARAGHEGFLGRRRVIVPGALYMLSAAGLKVLPQSPFVRMIGWAMRSRSPAP